MNLSLSLKSDYLMMNIELSLDLDTDFDLK